MEIFGLTRLLLALLSICYPPKGTSALVQCFYWVLTILYLSVHVLGISASIRYGLDCGLDDIEGALYATFQFSGCVNLIYTSVAGVIYRSDFTQTMDRYVDLHKKEPELGLPIYLDRANTSCQRITWYFIILFLWTYVMEVFLVGTIITYCLLTDGYVDHKYFFKPLKFRLPWNQDCIAGWIAEHVFSALYAGTYLNVVAAFLSFFMGICMYHEAFTSFIQSLQVKINEQLHIELIDQNEVKLLLRKSIDTYNLAKDLFEETKTLFSRFYFIQLICSMVQLSCSIFEFDMGLQHPGFNLLTITESAAGSGAVLFLNCYFGERATNCYLDMAEHYYMLSKWYKLPINLQKYYIILIQSAQRPIYYDGLGIAYLNIPTFAKMIRAVISYYITFRALVA